MARAEKTVGCRGPGTRKMMAVLAAVLRHCAEGGATEPAIEEQVAVAAAVGCVLKGRGSVPGGCTRRKR
jgi:hypothetical protein